MKTQGHFWIIFANIDFGWEPLNTPLGGLEIKAFRSRAEAQVDLYEAQQRFGRGRVRLYKFKPEAFILGFNRPERNKS